MARLSRQAELMLECAAALRDLSDRGVDGLNAALAVPDGHAELLALIETFFAFDPQLRKAMLRRMQEALGPRLKRGN